MTFSPRDQVEQNGYVIRQILEGDELARAQDAAERILERAYGPDGPQGGQKTEPFLSPGSPFEPFYSLAHDRRITGVIESILGGDLVWEGAALLVSGPDYIQGWHRDVLQVPEDQIDEGWYSKNVFFNNIQLNMGLFDDASLWIVPASHNRRNTAEEDRLFAGTKHMSAVEVDMPGAIPVELQAGQCVFYNNNLIHRGHNHRKQKRVTYHCGYMRRDLPPTWHLYVTRLGGQQEAYIRTLSPELNRMYDEHMAVRRQYPDASGSWPIPDVVRR